jgi:elongation factor Ts
MPYAYKHMANIDLLTLKKLRDETSASIADCRRAIDESNGDYAKALAWLKKRAVEKAEKKADRETSQGLIEAYIHQGKVGVLVEILCETDFVAKTDEFKHLAKEIAMHIAAMNPENVASLLKQEYIRDSSHTIEQLVKGVIGKLGENITIKRFQRFAIGE